MESAAQLFPLPGLLATVSACSVTGKSEQYVCQLSHDSDVRVEARSDPMHLGFDGWDSPPVSTVMYEPDYISPWRATSRAFLLEQSLVLSHLSQHFDALFFEPFIKDVCHPFSAGDLSELGLPVDWPEEEPSDRPDQSEVPNFEDAPSDSSVSDGQGNRIPGQPLRQLPSWVTDLWNLLQYEGATELLEEGPIIYVSS